MKTSKLELMQSGLERRKEADQLNTSLQLLSKTLRDFLTLTEQSELPIMQSTMLLHNVHQTTEAVELHLRSILTEIENLSPQAIQTLITSYMEQIQALKVQLSNIDISSIKTVTTSI